jgi:hypothetical protein
MRGGERNCFTLTFPTSGMGKGRGRDVETMR